MLIEAMKLIVLNFKQAIELRFCRHRKMGKPSAKAVFDDDNCSVRSQKMGKRSEWHKTLEKNGRIARRGKPGTREFGKTRARRLMTRRKRKMLNLRRKVVDTIIPQLYLRSLNVDFFLVFVKLRSTSVYYTCNVAHCKVFVRDDTSHCFVVFNKNTSQSFDNIVRLVVPVFPPKSLAPVGCKRDFFENDIE